MKPTRSCNKIKKGNYYY